MPRGWEIWTVLRVNSAHHKPTKPFDFMTPLDFYSETHALPLGCMSLIRFFGSPKPRQACTWLAGNALPSSETFTLKPVHAPSLAVCASCLVG